MAFRDFALLSVLILGTVAMIGLAIWWRPDEN